MCRRRDDGMVRLVSGDSAAHMVGDSDADVLAAVSTELERFLPGVANAITMTHLIRWPHGANHDSDLPHALEHPVFRCD
jgi:hypothetical protein